MRQKESFCLYILDSFTVSLNMREVSLLGYIQRKKPIKLNYKPHKPYYKLQWHFFFVFVFQMFYKVFSVFIFSGSYFHVPVYVYNFCFFPFFEFIFATTILMMAPASCYRITSINYGGKKLKDAGLTWRYHLSNIMPDSIFCDSMLEFSRSDNCCFYQIRKDWCSFATITHWKWKSLNYNGQGKWDWLASGKAPILQQVWRI